jgi:hypothetical protein
MEPVAWNMGAIIATAHQETTIRTVCQSPNFIFMTRESSDTPSTFDVPDMVF